MEVVGSSCTVNDLKVDFLVCVKLLLDSGAVSGVTQLEESFDA
jgi:hypothetical protein